jgi:hypothetical protein
MARSIPEHDEACRLLRELLETVGLSHIVYLLTQIVEERRDLARADGDAERVRRFAHDARLLGDTAIRLLD